MTYVSRLKDELCATPEGLRMWQREKLVLDLTELICGLMLDREISRKQLAQTLGISVRRISNLLLGNTEMTVGQASDLLVAMGYELTVDAKKLEPEQEPKP